MEDSSSTHKGYGFGMTQAHYIYCAPWWCSLAQLCLILCYSMDCSPLSCFVHGILQARILEWVAVVSSRVSSWPRDRTHVSCVSAFARRFFTTSATWEALIKGYLYLNFWFNQMSLYIGCFPGGSAVKNLPAKAGDVRDAGFHPWVRKIPWRRAWQPTPVILPGKPHGQRSPAGSKSWTWPKRLSTAQHPDAISPVTNILHECGIFVTIAELIWRHYY